VKHCDSLTDENTDFGDKQVDKPATMWDLASPDMTAD